MQLLRISSVLPAWELATHVVQIAAVSMKFQPDPTKVFQALKACFSSADHPNGTVPRQSSDARPFG